MAGTINYLYDPNQQVWGIVTCGDDTPVVREGVVKRVRGEVLVTGQELEYDVQLNGDTGTTAILETDLFDTLAAAVAEYEVRLT